uniref:SH3 domain-containing protein n=1 Tax=Rhabditophanes sp. KR3021 TaxID=114890 RepID=A0AC35TXB6_9BILA
MTDRRGSLQTGMNKKMNSDTFENFLEANHCSQMFYLNEDNSHNGLSGKVGPTSLSNLKHSQWSLNGKPYTGKECSGSGISDQSHVFGPSPLFLHRRSQPSIPAYVRHEGEEMRPFLKHQDSCPRIYYDPIKRYGGRDRTNSIIAKNLPPYRLHQVPSQPLLMSTSYTPYQQNPNITPYSSPVLGRRCPPKAHQKFLRRAHKSDLHFRFQKHLEENNHILRSQETRAEDPVYLALKHANQIYGRRGSASQNYDSVSPSPRNLSQTSLQDSGYIENSIDGNSRFLGSSPHLSHSSGVSNPYYNSTVVQSPVLQQNIASNGHSQHPNTSPSGPQQQYTRQRPPKLEKQMKSLSLDCADMPPTMSSTVRQTYQRATAPPPNTKPANGGWSGRGCSSNLDDQLLPDAHRNPSLSSHVPSPRRLPPNPVQVSSVKSHIVIHEYTSTHSNIHLLIGQRLKVVDNGDPDWLHGFLMNDHSERLFTFPSTCVSPIYGSEQPMRVIQNILISENKLRLYRDQVVFAQADSLKDNTTVLIRTERDKLANCPLSNLSLI